MAVRKNVKVTAAAGLASILVVACMATATDTPSQEGEGVAKAMGEFCSAATGSKEECMQGEALPNITEAKEFIRTIFDSAVAELQIAIKNTSIYKKVESDRLTRGALEVCEDVLADAIDEIRTSFDQVNKFEIGQMDHALDEVKIWLSAAITFKDTCYDAFAKTRGKSKRVVRQMLKASGRLMSKALGLVIAFQKNFQSFSKDLGTLVDRITDRQLLDEIPDHARKLVQTPKISLPPNVVVAQDGSGQFTTITDAVNSIPFGSKTPFVILVKAGVYAEYVEIPKGKEEIIMIGEGPLKTRITGNKNYGVLGIGTFHTATLTVEGRGFIAKDIGIENTAGPVGEQAVALRTTGDVGVFYNVHIDGYQDTLYPHVKRQLFRECRITGTIDFIFGNAIAVFQKCDLVVRKPDPNQDCMVTAQGRTEQNMTGITIIQGCTITAEKEFLEAQPPFKAYLGRPWKYLSRTIIMQSTIEAFISPEGWSRWNGMDAGLDTLFYAEFDNKGPGADISKRVVWPGLKQFTTKEEAQQFTPLVHFVEDQWIKDSGVPYDPSFM